MEVSEWAGLNSNCEFDQTAMEATTHAGFVHSLPPMELKGLMFGLNMYVCIATPGTLCER